MDLLSSRSGFSPGQSGSLSELPTALQQVSIHGTLPRRKKAGHNLVQGGFTWDHRANQSQSKPYAPLSPGPVQPLPSPLVQSIKDDFHGHRDHTPALDAAVDYVKFSRDQFILDCPPEKLRRELEEELKMNGDEPRSHAWYHGAIPRQVAENLVQRDGDFLVRDSLSSPGSYVLTCQWRNAAQHFKVNKKVVMLNEAYSRVEFRLDREGFDSVPALVRFYVGNRKPVSQVVGAIIFQPINRALPLRCLEEKYGLSTLHRESGLTAQDKRNQKRLSLNITNGLSHDKHSHDTSPCQDHGLIRGQQLRLKDRCGSQPASLNQILERRRPLKAHQSESFLPLGCKPVASPDAQSPSPCPKSPVFRTGSEPLLSPTVSRRSTETGQTIRGSDSQLCPKPPPKPSKVLLSRLPRSPGLTPLAPPPAPPPALTSQSQTCSTGSTRSDSLCLDTPSSTWRSAVSTGVRPHYLLLPPDSSSSEVVPLELDSLMGQTEQRQPSPAADLRSRSPLRCPDTNSVDNLAVPCCFVDRLGKDADAEGQRRGLDRSSYHNAIAALENTSEEEEDDALKAEEEEEEYENDGGGGRGFQRPVMETESAFSPAAFDSRLLPEVNKPLEMSVLKRSKELLLSHDHHSIAKHMLLANCQVARILGVTAEVKGRMGVSSGLELVTLPHGQQLRLDLMERHQTMAIGVAVDILGCTGSVEERASTLNRIVLVATELKDNVGDLFAFTALMKALDMPQITRLEETWTVLRRNFTQTAIGYEKVLKPFYKNLFEGTAPSGSGVCVPLLMPLLTLMERPPLGPEGAELWETSDHGCDIMLCHLEAAREMAQNSEKYTTNALKVLQGFEVDKDLLEVFKTDFQLRLLWGSRGATVNQADRYSKFNLILTALSRKLEPPPKTQTLI